MLNYIYRAVALCETALLLEKINLCATFSTITIKFYHIYNRGVEKRDVFCDEKDFERFLKGMRVFNAVMTKEARSSKLGFATKPSFELLASAPIVDIISYNLLPNHFHLCLKQLQNKGIPKFMHKLGVGYTKYFNLKNDRVGSLFQGAYKAKLIDSPDYLNYLSAYIHGNYSIHNHGRADNWPWSSYQGYLNQKKWLNNTDHPIISNFESAHDYQQFVESVIENSSESKLAKKCEF